MKAMFKKILILTATAVLAGYFLYVSLGSQTTIAQNGHDPHHAAAPDAWARGDEFERALAAGMDKMHREMMAPSPTGNADVDFLATMIPHHAGAIEMGRLALIHGKDPLVRRLAEEIIASQQAEIAAMKARLEILQHGADPSPGGYPTLGSTRGVGQ